MKEGKEGKMGKVSIAPFDDTAKRKLINAVGLRGQASGLEAAAKILAAMADHKGRVVGTRQINDVAEALRDKAAALRIVADRDIHDLEQQSS